MTQVEKQFKIQLSPKERSMYREAKFNTLDDALYIYNTKIATVGDTQLTRRVLSHWQGLGLLPYEKRGWGWRRFCLEDLCWLQIVGELRKFGLAIEKIKEVKKVLFSEIRIPNNAHTGLRIYTKLEMAIGKMLFEKKESFLVVYLDGKAEIVSDFDVKNAKDNFIFVRFSSILENVFKSENVSVIYDNPELNEEEISLLLLVRSGDYEKINVRFKNGKMSGIEKGVNVADKNKVVEQIKDILKNGSFGEIVLQQEGGKIVSFKHNIRENFAIRKT